MDSEETTKDDDTWSLHMTHCVIFERKSIKESPLSSGTLWQEYKKKHAAFSVSLQMKKP
jgi:hypothetical protein